MRYLRYLNTTRCIYDLLHFFLGWAILTSTELLGIIKVQFHVTDTLSTSVFAGIWPITVINVFVVFSMFFTFCNLFFHMFSKSVAKYEPYVFLFLTVIFALLPFAIIAIIYLFDCFTINLIFTIILLTLQAVLYGSHSKITQKKWKDFEITHPIAPPPPPDYSVIMPHHSPFFVPIRLTPCLPDDNHNDDDSNNDDNDNISCSMNDIHSANSYNL